VEFFLNSDSRHAEPDSGGRVGLSFSFFVLRAATTWN